MHIIVLYFDDILITIIFIIDIGSVIPSLRNAFSMIDLGLLKQFLGLAIEQSDAGIKISQSKYVANMLFKLKMD